MAGPSLVEQRVHAHGDLVDFPAPKEELLTVAIDDTTNTVFITGIARFSCHVCTYAIPVSYIHGIVKGTPGNPEVTPFILEVLFMSRILPSGFYRLPMISREIHGFDPEQDCIGKINSSPLRLVHDQRKCFYRWLKGVLHTQPCSHFPEGPDPVQPLRRCT